MENLNLEPNEEHKQIKPKIRTKINPIPELVAELDPEIILEHIADVEKEIKELKTRGPKPKPAKIPKPAKPAKILIPEPEPTQIIFIKGPVVLDFEEN